MIKRIGYLLGASLAALSPSAVLAQIAQNPAAGDNASSGGLAEIVVTAQKRSENLQKIPISVMAIGDTQLSAAGITKTSDIGALVPGLVFTNTLGGGVSYIRGIGQTLGVPGAESPVGLYIDGIYLVTPASGLFEFNNIERIEVLRGPQGTLFGRNTTGGVINILTKDPQNDTKIDADIGFANYNTFSGHFYGTSGLGDNLSVSVAAFGYDRTHGFGRNVTLGIDLLKEKNWGVQNKWKWESPDNKTTVIVNLLHSYSQSEVGSTYGVPKGSIGGDGSLYLGRYTFASNVHEPAINKQNLASLKITHDLDFAQIVNITAYHTLKQRYRFAQLGYDNNSLAATNPFAAQYPNLIATDNTFTEEFQIQAPSHAKLQWIAGIYYMDDRIPTFHSESKPNNVLRVNVDSSQKTKSYAAFAQATYPIRDDTRLTAGLRYTSETKQIAGQAALATGLVISTPASPGSGAPPLDPKATWNKLTYRVSLDHDFSNDVLGFASYNRGFKGGVYNLASFVNTPANPETVDAYEVGLKMMLLDRRLRFNVSAFYTDYKDIQLRTSVTSATGTFFIVYNAATARMKGVDVDFEAKASDRLTFNGGFELLDAHYRSFPSGVYAFPNPLTAANLPVNCRAPAAFNPVPGGNTTLTCDLSGNRMIRSPKLTYTFGANYRMPLAGGASLAFNANDQYNSGFFWDPEDRLRQNRYHNVSASMTYTAASGIWDVQLWGKNLTNAHIDATSTGATSDTYSPGLPRTYGVQLGVHF